MENKISKQTEYTKPMRVKLTENDINIYFSKINKLPSLEQLKNVGTVNKLPSLERLQNFNATDNLPSLVQLKTNINLHYNAAFAYYDKVTNWFQENKNVKKWFDYTPEKWNEIVEEFDKLSEEKQQNEQIAFYPAF